jgi:hypothetical protein
MILLLDCHLLGRRPIRVATEADGPSGSNVVLKLPPLISAGDAVVVGADWMEPMRTAVGTHFTDLLHLGLPAHAIAVAACAGTAVGVQVLVVDHLCGHGGDGGSELLDLALHCCQFSFVCTLTALSVALAAPALASYWIYSLISLPYLAS